MRFTKTDLELMAYACDMMAETAYRNAGEDAVNAEDLRRAGENYARAAERAKDSSRVRVSSGAAQCTTTAASGGMYASGSGPLLRRRGSTRGGSRRSRERNACRMVP